MSTVMKKCAFATLLAADVEGVSVMKKMLKQEHSTCDAEANALTCGGSGKTAVPTLKACHDKKCDSTKDGGACSSAADCIGADGAGPCCAPDSAKVTEVCTSYDMEYDSSKADKSLKAPKDSTKCNEADKISGLDKDSYKDIKDKCCKDKKKDSDKDKKKKSSSSR